MYEGRLHEGKPANIPEAGQGNSFRRTIRSVKSGVQAGEREENSSLISPVGAHLIILKQDRAGRNPGAILFHPAAGRDAASTRLPTKTLQSFLQKVGHSVIEIPSSKARSDPDFIFRIGDNTIEPVSA
jgi:hypothetical protein